MIVAAHQPAYIPWLGYLDKIAKADVFVVMDDLQYEAQNFQNRNRLKLNNGAAWITVPLANGSQTDRVLDRRIDNAGFGGRHHWQHRTWRTLVTHYGKAPFFSLYARDLEAVYAHRWDRLVDLDLCLLGLACRWLGIVRPILRASSLGLSGTKTDRILDLCQKLGASVYLSGSGGSVGYLDTNLLARSGISTVWQHFAHPRYPQRYPHLGFVSHLGFFDFVLNCGGHAATSFLNAAVAQAEGLSA